MQLSVRARVDCLLLFITHNTEREIERGRKGTCLAWRAFYCRLFSRLFQKFFIDRNRINIAMMIGLTTDRPAHTFQPERCPRPQIKGPENNTTIWTVFVFLRSHNQPQPPSSSADSTLDWLYNKGRWSMGHQFDDEAMVVEKWRQSHSDMARSRRKCTEIRFTSPEKL